MIFVRWAISMGMAGGFLGLFYFMQFLIATGEAFDERISVVKIVDATMPEIELEVIEEIDKPEPIEELVQEQPEIQERQTTLDAGPALNIERQSVDDTGLDFSNASISATDGDYLPCRDSASISYARGQRGIQGWCLVSLLLTGWEMWLRKQFKSSMRNHQIYLVVPRSGRLSSSFSHELLTDRVLK